MKHLFTLVLTCAAVLAAGEACATDVATRPLRPDLAVPVNVIFGQDDSASMDFEVLLSTNDGAMWWDFDTATGWGVDPTHLVPQLRDKVAPWFNPTGQVVPRWRKYAYLFPNGVSPGHRARGDKANGHFAVLPTTQFAFVRSPAHNPLFYDTRVTYKPWAPAQLSSGWFTPPNAATSAVRSHPVLPVDGGETIDLALPLAADTRDDFVFTAMAGMLIPAGAKKSICESDNKPSTCTAWTELAMAESAESGKVTRVALSYFPATFWMKEVCVPESSDPLKDQCTVAPDGSTLKRYEIRPGVSFPSGRSYADELRNFANWFQYYRKRRLMLAGAMGRVLETLRGMRVGVVAFNKRADAVMYDTDSATPATSARRVAGLFYEADAGGGTPTRETLHYIGGQFRRTDAPGKPAVVQGACQRNNAFIVTDGFAGVQPLATTPWDPGTSAATYGSGVPYQTTYDGSAADIALRLYTNNPRPDLPHGAVPPVPLDSNANLHVNTYALTIGARGSVFLGEGSAYPADGAWPAPTLNLHPYSIDDLWHATLNGRGRMYAANTPEETAQRVKAGLDDMLDRAGSQSSIALSSVNLGRGDGRTYRSTYNPRGWSGDVVASAIDSSTGSVAQGTLWSFAERLAARPASSRTIVSSNGSAGVPFTWGHVGTLMMPGAAPGTVDFLRGDRAGEGSLYRTRQSLVGGATNAKPVVSARHKVVYAATGEGMVHAIDAESGDELWAFVPSSAIPGMAASANPSWVFQSLLDGTPSLVDNGSSAWLIGGRGVAGAGFYALDVSEPRGLSETARAAKLMWEFPNASTPADVRATLGLAVGRPLVVKTHSHGQVVLLTSGYNANAKDGKGRVFMLAAASGNLLKTFVADASSSGEDPGLAQLSAMLEDDGTVRHAYAGDEKGNLWHFDLDDAGSGTTRLATLRSGAGEPQPVTTAPELVRIGTDRIVLVGTGRLLGVSDFGAATMQSFYAIKDGSTLGTVAARDALARREFGELDSSGRAKLSGAAFSWTDKRGWYFDLPAGQQVNTDPSVAFGAVAFVSNRTQASDCRSASTLYVADVGSGLQAAGRDTAMEPVADSMASGVVILAATGKPGVSTIGDITTADDRVVKKDLQSIPGVDPRKTAWRQVRRQ